MNHNMQDNKVKPQEVGGTITITSGTINVGTNSVKNNESTKPSEEFIEILEKGSKEKIFPPFAPDNGN